MAADMESQLTYSQAKLNPERGSYLAQTAQKCYDALFNPLIRLKTEFPWDLKQSARVYSIAAVFYIVGSIVPLIAIFGSIWVAAQYWPDQVLPLVANDEGHPSSTLMLVAILSSFIIGFGAELLFLKKQLQKSGIDIIQLIGLNLKTLNGDCFDALKRSLIALVIAISLQSCLDFLPLPHPQQETANLAANLDGFGLFSFGVLASILAPFFEEVIFRGCLFSAFRSIFRQGKIFELLGGNHRTADLLAVGLSAAIFAGAHLEPTAFAQLFILGVVLAELYRRTGTLVCPIMLHAMNNLMATLLISLG